MNTVVNEVRSWLLPVSSSVKLILYSVMIPFLKGTEAGGVQDRPTDVELMTETLRFAGGLDGAVYSMNKYRCWLPSLCTYPPLQS